MTALFGGPVAMYPARMCRHTGRGEHAAAVRAACKEYNYQEINHHD
jgi:hypothetical protein